MAKVKHHNRQARRSRKVLQTALLDLLCDKSYTKITISDITRKADLARPTFYAHYETKDHLLTSIIDEFLIKFFNLLNERDPGVMDAERDKKINISFFKIAHESEDIVCLMQILDIDALFLKRFQYYWAEYIKGKPYIYESDSDQEFFDYTNNFLAYAKFSLLKTWVDKGMKTDIEVVGNLMYNLTGPPTLNKAKSQFQKMVQEK